MSKKSKKKHPPKSDNVSQNQPGSSDSDERERDEQASASAATESKAADERTSEEQGSEEFDEAQRAGQRRPEPAPEIPMIFPIKETDDMFVRGFKHIAQGVVDRWRVLLVFGVIGLVVALAVVITLGEQRAQEQRAWDEYLTMDTIAELELLTETHTEYETLPWVYLKLIERLEAQAAEEEDRSRALERLSTRIDEFLRIAGDDEVFAGEVRRLQNVRARAQRDLEVLERIAEREEEEEEAAQAERPQPKVVEPVLDVEAGQYEPLPNPVVVFEAEDGSEIRFELFEDRTPNTVANLIWLIEQGYYDHDGPGGFLETDGPETDPQQRLIGRFVAKDPPIQGMEEILEEDGPQRERVARLDERWHGLFPQRSIGYTIPFEEAGAFREIVDAFGEVVERRVRPVRAGDLVMDMEPPAREAVGSLPMPGMAEGAFRIARNRVPEYDGRYVIFGRIADEASSEALDQLPEETALQRAWVESLRPKLVPRTVTVRPELEVPGLEELLDRLDGDIDKARDMRERARGTIERLNKPVFVERGPRGNLRPRDEASEAAHLALHPAQLEWIPAGQGYRDAEGEVQTATNDETPQPATIDWFAEDPEAVEAHRIGALVPVEAQPSRRWALFPGWYDDEAIRLLPTTRPVYSAEGEPVAREYRPMVRYWYYTTLDADPNLGFVGDIVRFPALMPAQETPPDRLPTIDLFSSPFQR